jgi:hypothetical protein
MEVLREVREMVEKLAVSPPGTDIVDTVRRQVIAEQLGAARIQLVEEVGDWVDGRQGPAEEARRRGLRSAANLVKALAMLDSLSKPQPFPRFRRTL